MRIIFKILKDTEANKWKIRNNEEQVLESLLETEHRSSH